MKCQILFSGKNKSNISKCHQLKFYTVLSSKVPITAAADDILDPVVQSIVNNEFVSGQNISCSNKYNI